MEELLAERGAQVDNVTVYRWVQRFAPLLADAGPFAREANLPEYELVHGCDIRQSTERSRSDRRLHWTQSSEFAQLTGARRAAQTVDQDGPGDRPGRGR